MRIKKKELGYSYEQISELAGIPVGTVQKVLGGITKSPRYATLQALQKVFEKESGTLTSQEEDSDFNYDRNIVTSDRVEEGLATYGTVQSSDALLSGAKQAGYLGKEKRQGEYTLNDYFALPKKRRAELIDGVFYDMSAPTHLHQAIAYRICRCFDDYIQKNQGPCRPFMAPLDVQLDCDDRTMVQPDVLIVCDRDKLRHGRIYGAPDLVVEIISRGTLIKDTHLKRVKYTRAGVKEYWLVYPEQKTVVVYDLKVQEQVRIYGFADSVPVGIFDGACKVDFSEINEYVGFLYDCL